MTTRIHSFTDPLPPTLYWDASFVVNFSYEAARYFQQCADFLARLDERSTISYVSTLAMDEACFVLLQLKGDRGQGHCLSGRFAQRFSQAPSEHRAFRDPPR